MDSFVPSIGNNKLKEYVISIDTGKVLDVEALSQACKEYELREH